MGRSFLRAQSLGPTRAAQGQQLGHGTQIPVGIADVAMAQIDRQGEDFGIELFLALAIPAQQALDGEGVAQIVQTGAGLLVLSV